MKMKREMGLPAGKRVKMPSVKKDLREAEQVKASPVPGGPVPGVRGPKPGGLGPRANMKPKPSRYQS